MVLEEEEEVDGVVPEPEDGGRALAVHPDLSWDSGDLLGRPRVDRGQAVQEGGAPSDPTVLTMVEDLVEGLGLALGTAHQSCPTGDGVC